jgi:hypothetical protein
MTFAEVLDQAIALAEELGMCPLQAHCYHGLGTLYAATGRREPARAALATAIALYRDMDTRAASCTTLSLPIQLASGNR